MQKRIAYFDYGQVYPPLADGNPPVVADEPEPDALPAPRLRICQVVALLWYIAFSSFMLAAIIYLLRYPLSLAEYSNDPRAIGLGVAIGCALCGITLVVHRCAQ